MGVNTSIGWANHTFNPWQGCHKVSPGCAHCYAAAHDARHLHEPESHWGRSAPRLFASDSYMAQPLLWNCKAERLGKRHRVFCMSMGDLFELHETPIYAMLQANYRAQVFELVERTPWLDWMMLTKRPDNIAPMLPTRWRASMPRNVWLGASIEDQARAELRLPVLLDTASRVFRSAVSVLFVSCEPLLGAIDLARAAPGHDMRFALDLVIAGEESGRGSRPADLDWFRSLRDQCRRFDIAFYFKQLCPGGRKRLLPYLDGERWAELPAGYDVDDARCAG